MRRRIPLFEIYWDNEDVEEMANVVKGGSYWATGPSIEEFEEGLSKYVGRTYCVTFNSGTSALHSALLAHDIEEGDEVIVPSFTFIATANAPLFVGAKPIFSDIETRTYGLDPAEVERKITSKTKAILPIHYAGCPCSILELKRVAKRHGLVLLEDAAESLGARINGRMVGTIGDSAVLSFCQNKIITTGEGGAVLTDSREVYEKLMLVRSHGRLEDGDYFTSMERPDYVTLGYNFRMSTITAALGKAQLGKIVNSIKLRRANALYMSKRLSQIDEIETFKAPNGYHHVYQMYTIRVKGGSGVRERLMKHLFEKGITTKVYFSPVHLTEFYRHGYGHRKGELSVTEKIASEVLTLPMFPTLKREEMDYIARQIEAFFSE